MGCAESSITLFFATAAIAALKKLDVGPAMPAFFRLALTTVAVKSLLSNFPHNPPACINHEVIGRRIDKRLYIKLQTRLRDHQRLQQRVYSTPAENLASHID